MKSRHQNLALKMYLTRVDYALLDEVNDMIKEEQSRKKWLWVRDWIGRRYRRGASTLLKELAAEDVNEYKICLRMTPERFDNLLGMVAHKIERQNTQIKDAISPRPMLEVTLHFMATKQLPHSTIFFQSFEVVYLQLYSRSMRCNI
jgi:hypothetical protein